MSLPLRNVITDPASPVTQWPYEALVTAIERGTVGDWARIAKAIDADPWGSVGRQVEEYLGYREPWGVGPLLRRAVIRARHSAESRERLVVAGRVRTLIATSGLSQLEFASRIGTSGSRLSTYGTGKVVPSAALMVRMENLVAEDNSSSVDILP
ncbi:MAG: helix-turn-helix domain-containing protein [Nakamurella sp.]